MKEIHVVTSGVVKGVAQGGNSLAHQVHEIESLKQLLYHRKFEIGYSRGSCQTRAFGEDLG